MGMDEKNEHPGITSHQWTSICWEYSFLKTLKITLGRRTTELGQKVPKGTPASEKQHSKDCHRQCRVTWGDAHTYLYERLHVMLCFSKL